MSDGGLFQGVFTYNSSNVFASTLVGSTTNSSVSGTVNGSASATGGTSGFSYIAFFENTGNAVDLVYAGSTFNGVLCTTASTNCGGQPSTIANVANFLGSTAVTVYVAPTSTAATPEPSSLALLGTGVLGLAGIVRKRLV